jgi:TfoX/Sxy family transcriptional regulator of competence genes
MASDQEFVEYVCDQISGAGVISYRQMFGEYAIYCDGKVVALVCDDEFYVKSTPSGRALVDRSRVGGVEEAPPYPGAKPYLLIGERLEDREWVSNLIRTTERETPAPKPRKRKSDSENS